MKDFLTRYHPSKIFKIKSAFLIALPASALAGLIYHFQYESWSFWLLTSMIAMYALNIFAISAGYHRLFSHRAYKASWPVRAFLLFFGTSTVENSVLTWASDHRVHHKYEDTEKDPYNIREGFFYAHIGWIMLKTYKPSPLVKDLQKDKLVMFQHNYYFPLVIVTNLIPFFITYALTGALIGSFTFSVLLRLVIVHHITYFINSYCHTFGTQPYTDENTAKDSVLIAPLTFGESYHNFHHKFQADYRNGYMWYNLDATKWIVYLWDKCGLVSNLIRTSDDKVLEARMIMKEKRKDNFRKFELAPEMQEQLENFKQQAVLAKKKLERLKREYKTLSKQQLDEAARLKINEIKSEIDKMKMNFKFAYNQWLNYLKYAPTAAA